MSSFIVLVVLVSAAMHPFWNLLLKQGGNPFRTYVYLTATISVFGLAHALVSGADILAALEVWPLILVSCLGQILYGLGLTATLRRGDLSAYYPIVRSSPVFIVIAGFLFLGETYSIFTIGGILLVVAGGFLLLYRRGSNILSDPVTLAFALIAMSGTAIYSLADTRLMQTLSPAVQMFWVEGLLTPFYVLIYLFSRQKGTEPRPRTPLLQKLKGVLLPGAIAYASYSLILLAYQLGGEVAAVTSIRQASIPVSVLLGGYFLREGAVARRLIASLILAMGIIVIVFTS